VGIVGFHIGFLCDGYLSHPLPIRPASSQPCLVPED
jgi:hypothetical protein